jgi:hypothetical protein
MSNEKKIAIYIRVGNENQLTDEQRIEKIKERLNGDISLEEVAAYMVDDINYLLSLTERYKEALEYYADLYMNIEKHIQEGELIVDWLKMQGMTARKALEK